MGHPHNNPSFKLVYLHVNYNELNGFTDSDWGSSDSRQSTTGLLAQYNKSIVLWGSKMQNTIATLSTAGAEYYSASKMAVETIYLRNLI